MKYPVFYYDCANDDVRGHPGVVVAWSAPFGAPGHDICPKCGATATSAVRKNWINLQARRLRRLVRQSFKSAHARARIETRRDVGKFAE